MQRQSWPTAWLMSDERMGDGVDAAVRRAARAGAGIIVRHHASSHAERRRLAALIEAEGALLGIARDLRLARDVGAALIHDPDEPSDDLPFSLPVHDAAEALAARDSQAALVFVSPLYPTRSHPGAPALGAAGALALALTTRKPAIALGGVTGAEWKELEKLGWAGWAGIDAWLRT